jgi:sugar phosphate isomerase/epimerase
MKFAICQEMFEDWEWERQCDVIAEIGYTGIEAAPFALASSIYELEAERRVELRQQAESRGLEIIGLHWLLAQTDGLYLTSPEQAIRDATRDYVIALGDACADLGGDLMVFGSPAQRNLLEGVSRDEAMGYAAEVFAGALPRLAQRGVSICMEPLTTNETDFILTCADAVELIERVESVAGVDNFLLHQDVKAMVGQETEPVPVLIHRHKDRLGHVHVNDTNLLGPGMGETDFVPILEALEQIEYDGWVSVEVFDYEPGAESIARTSYENLQQALAAARDGGDS